MRRLVCRLARRHWWVYYGHDVSACRCLVCRAYRPDCTGDYGSDLHAEQATPARAAPTRDDAGTDEQEDA